MSRIARFLAGRIAGKPLCKTHPSAEAYATCGSCLLPICDVCSVSDGKGGYRCPECVRGRRTRTFMLAAGGVAVAAAMALGGLYLVPRLRPAQDERAAPSAKPPTLQESVEKEPCDRDKVYELVAELVKNGDNRGAIDRAKWFFDRCGDDRKVRAWVYTARFNLSEWDAAAAEASKLIESDPNVARYWSFRGMAYERKQDLQAAAADYRQAMAVQPDVTLIPFNLAGIYERLATPCEAIGPIEQFLHYHPGSRDEATSARLSRLYATEGCSGMTGSGRALIRFGAGSSTIKTTVLVNEKAGVFVVDTGATSVVLASHFADAVGLDYAKWPSILVATAGGIKKAKTGTLAHVAVQGVKAAHVEGVVAEDLPPGIQGLLGVSFLSRFVVHLDSQKGLLEITAREAKK